MTPQMPSLRGAQRQSNLVVKFDRNLSPALQTSLKPSCAEREKRLRARLQPALSSCRRRILVAAAPAGGGRRRRAAGLVWPLARLSSTQVLPVPAPDCASAPPSG